MTTQRFTQSSTSPGAPGTAAGLAIAGLDDFESVVVIASLLGATGGVLDVYLQAFDGTNWFDVAHYTQLAAGATLRRYSVLLGRGAAAAAPVQVGLDLEGVLAANTVVPGTLTDRLRLLFVAGASTTVGAAQVLTVVGTEERLAELEERDLDLRVR